MPTAKQPKTRNTEELTSHLFNEDISGLYKVMQPVTILNNTLRYLKPGIVQSGLMMNSLFEAVSESLFTKDELLRKSTVDVWIACSEYLTSVSKDDSQLQALWVKIMTNTKAVELLFETIRQCFPDIQEPHKLTDVALAELYAHLLNDTIFNPDNQQQQ